MIFRVSSKLFNLCYKIKQRKACILIKETKIKNPNL